MFDLEFFLQQNRLGNIFGQQQPTFGGPYATPGFNPNPNLNQMGQQQPFDFGARMNELYKPQNIMQDRFASHLDAFPERQEPSTLRKIGSVIYAMGQKDPIAAGDAFRNFHYNNALQDWQKQAPFLQQGADNERLMNINERMWANQQATGELNQRRLDESTRAAQEREELNRIRETRLREHNTAKIQLAEWKAQNPNGQLKVGNDGFVYVINPQNGQSVKTAVQSNELSDLERMNLQLTNALELEGVRNENRLGQIDAQGQQNRLTRQTPTGAASNILNRPLTTAQQTARAKQAVSEHPEWAPYIQFSPSGQLLRVAVPEGSNGIPFLGWGAKPGGDATILPQINAYIFGQPSATVPETKVTPGPNNANFNTPTNGQVIRQQSPSTGKIRESTDGGKTWRIIN